MVGGANSAAHADKAFPKIPPLPQEAPLPQYAGPAARREAGVATYASRETDSLHLKYTNRDGDVLEVDFEHSEETFAGVAFVSDQAGSEAPADTAEAGPGGRADVLAGPNAEAAQAAGEADDPRLAKLARLRDWAAQVADEVRKQQQRILEESLKRSGRYMPGCEGRFIVIHDVPKDGEEAEPVEGDCEEGIPEYWNAENTSDRIVHFATQMAEIAGDDADLAETIIQAVADGFDQANAETGPLPGAAGELNRKTRELTFSKLSKWLEDRKSMGYNQGARTDENPTLAAPDGTQNHEQ